MLPQAAAACILHHLIPNCTRQQWLNALCTCRALAFAQRDLTSADAYLTLAPLRAPVHELALHRLSP